MHVCPNCGYCPCCGRVSWPHRLPWHARPQVPLPPIYVGIPPVVFVHQLDPAAVAVRALSGKAA